MCFLSRYEIGGTSGYFLQEVPVVSGDWHQVVLVFHGLNNGEGITVYNNGTQMAMQSMKTEEALQMGDGRVIIGRLYTELNGAYCSVEVDDLMLWNEALTQQDVAKLINE